MRANYTCKYDGFISWSFLLGTNKPRESYGQCVQLFLECAYENNSLNSQFSFDKTIKHRSVDFVERTIASVPPTLRVNPLGTQYALGGGLVSTQYFDLALCYDDFITVLFETYITVYQKSKQRLFCQIIFLCILQNKGLRIQVHVYITYQCEYLVIFRSEKIDVVTKTTLLPV